MSVIQSTQNELRFMKRQALEEEARLYQNMYRDIIHNYGIDCRYYKLQIPEPEMFKQTLDLNNMILHAYGVEIDPKYPLSSEILAYMDVESDAFALNKYGIEPNMDVNFIFDINEFASKFAWKLGQIKEFKISEREIVVEVPRYNEIDLDFPISFDRDCPSCDCPSCDTPSCDTPSCDTPSCDNQPSSDNEVDVVMYDAFTFVEQFQSDILSGKAMISIPRGEIGRKYSIPVRKYNHSDGGYSIPVNKDIARSFYYNVDIKEYLDIYLFFDYVVEDIVVDLDYRGRNIYSRVIKGILRGSILFRDMSKMSRYMETIHPDVGDIVTIDFPDERSREQYEITECVDKNLGPEGISPLLHKYIWKCKAKRYVNSGEDSPEYNEANDRKSKTIEMIQNSEERVVEQISKYDTENSDAVYGGYERDIQKPVVDEMDKIERPIFLDDGSFMDIVRFQDGSHVTTDGFELYFVSDGRYTKLTMTRLQDTLPGLPQSKTNTIFATDDMILFRNIEGQICTLFQDNDITPGQMQMCFNAIMDTRDVNHELNCDGIIHGFPNCSTVMISTNGMLFCRLGNKSKKMIRFA